MYANINSQLRFAVGCFSLLAPIWASAQKSPSRPTIPWKVPVSHFENDKRLDKPMTVVSQSYHHATLWAKITAITRVPITREPSASEFDSSPILLTSKQVTTRAIMDAVAVRVMARWERTEDKGYKFLVPSAEMDHVYRPINAYEKERFAAARKFMDALNQVPQELRDRILGGDKIEVADLPSALKDPLLEMYETMIDQRNARGGGNPPFPASALNTGRMRLTRDAEKRFNAWYFSTAVKDVGSSSWRFNDYEETKQRREESRSLLASIGGKDALYVPQRNEISLDDLKELPAMKRSVRLTLDNATMSDVLMRLHKNFNISFVCDPEMDKPTRKNVDLPAMPLWKAMNRLTEIFPHTEWELRRSGIIIVRGQSNPARDKSRDNVSQSIEK